MTHPVDTELSLFHRNMLLLMNKWYPMRETINKSTLAGIYSLSVYDPHTEPTAYQKRTILNHLVLYKIS